MSGVCIMWCIVFMWKKDHPARGAEAVQWISLSRLHLPFSDVKNPPQISSTTPLFPVQSHRSARIYLHTFIRMHASLIDFRVDLYVSLSRGSLSRLWFSLGIERYGIQLYRGIRDR